MAPDDERAELERSHSGKPQKWRWPGSRIVGPVVGCSHPSLVHWSLGQQPFGNVRGSDVRGTAAELLRHGNACVRHVMLDSRPALSVQRCCMLKSQLTRCRLVVAIFQRLAGLSMGALEVFLLKFYQWVVDTAPADSWAVRTFTYLATGPFRCFDIPPASFQPLHKPRVCPLPMHMVVGWCGGKLLPSCTLGH